MLLEGKVMKLTQESIHVIVLGFSAATITAENIRQEFKYKSVSTSSAGTRIRFVVKSFDEEILHIFGSLMPAHTGSIHWLDRNSKDVSVLDSSTKKRKDKDGQIPEHRGKEAFFLDDHNYVKASKKQRTLEDAAEF
ncbi:hypothetical protein SLE2022_216940 [Rubroshorea leprosula]